MATLGQSLAKTSELVIDILASGAEGAYQKIKGKAPVYLKSLFVTTLIFLTLVPLFVVLKITTGYPAFAYIATSLAVVISLLLSFLWAPIGVAIGMLLEQTANPAKGGERYVKFVASVLFVELLASAYLMRMPFHQNLSAAAILVVSVAAAAMASLIWGSWFSGKTYAAITLALAVFSFALPSSSESFPVVLSVIDKNLNEGILDIARNPNRLMFCTIGLILIITSIAAAIIKRIFSWLPVFLLILIVLGDRAIWGGLGESLTKEISAQPSYPPNRRVITVQIRPDKWSEWIELPPGRDFESEFPGERTYLFPNGKTITVPNGKNMSLGMVPARKFKLKGDIGEAKITVL